MVPGADRSGADVKPDPSKPEFPHERGNHHSTMTGYSVEALFDFDAPRMIDGQLFDNRWRQVTFKESAFGVPATKRFTVELSKHGLYDYEAAQALRWWFHAVANFEGNEYCLKTRLIEHDVVSETRVTAKRAVLEEQYQRGLPA